MKNSLVRHGWAALVFILAMTFGGSCREMGGGMGNGVAVAEREIEQYGQRYEIAGADAWWRGFSVAERSFLFLVVEQLGVDVTVELGGSDGAVNQVVDAPIGAYGEEEVIAILEPGDYRISVSGDAQEPAAAFMVHQVALRPVAEGDEEHAEADQAHRVGWRLHRDEAAHQEALERYRRALAVWRAQDRPLREAITLEAMALAYWSLDQEEVAAALQEQAIALARRDESRHGRRRLAHMLDRLALWERQKFHRPGRTVDYVSEAVTLLEELGESRWLGRFLYHRARARFDLGQIQAALDDAEQAVAAAREPETRFDGKILEASAYLALASPREGRAAATQALEIAVARDDPRDVARSALILARAELETGDLEEAKAHAEQGVAELRRIGHSRSVVGGLQILSQVLRRQGDLVAARETLGEAIELLGSAAASPRLAHLELELGYLELLGEDPGAGLRRIERATDTFAKLGDARGEAAGLARGAEALRELRRLEEAAKRIDKALSLVEEKRAETDREDHRVRFFASLQEYFEIALDIELRRWEIEPSAALASSALALHERRLALEAREALRRQASLRPQADSPSATSVEERRLTDELSSIIRDPELDDAEREELADRHLQRLSELREVRRDRSRDPGASSWDLASFQRELDDDSVVLVYALGEERGAVWRVTRRGAPQLRLLDRSRQDLERRIGQWRRELLSARRTSTETLNEIGAGLGRDLLQPVLEEGDDERLVIVGEGALLTLPFSALPVRDGRSSARYLVERAEVSTLPSLAFLQELRRVAATRPPRPRKVAVFADAVYGPDDPRLALPTAVGGRSLEDGPPESPPADLRVDLGEGRQVSTLERTLTTAGIDQLSRLEASGIEAAEVLARAPGSESFVATGLEASKETLRDLELESYDTLHFAVHAVVDADRPDLSGLVFSLVDGEGRARDGFLRGFEIATLPLSAELVVLSACETGRGRIFAGEGILGLSRRFFDAGALRLLSSLWRVSDQHTAALMERFYEGLWTQDLRPAAALREAQRSLLADPASADPRYWAAFTLQGDWRRPTGW